jgi:hypothetical protein
LQGLKLFKVRYYNAAIQCFSNSGDPNLIKRCQAYSSADTGSELRGKYESNMGLAKDKNNGLKKHERAQMKKEAKDLLAESKARMNTAGILFSEIDMDQHAAQCFYSAGNTAGSAEIFFKQGKFG